MLLGRGECTSNGIAEFSIKDTNGKYLIKLRAHIVDGLNNELIIGYSSMQEMDVCIHPGEGYRIIF